MSICTVLTLIIKFMYTDVERGWTQMNLDSQKQQDTTFQHTQGSKTMLEETKHLKNTKEQISKQIDVLDHQINRLNKSFSDIIIDNEDRDRVHNDRRECTFLEKEITAWEARKAQPYQYRADVAFTENGSPVVKTYYVGLSPITINGQQIVLDWRSEMGMFALNENPVGEVGNIPCKKTLRRVFNIQRGILKEFHDTLTQGTEQNGTAYVDPFLLQLIKDERREHATNTIIGSISQKQFEIIGKSFERSFIVQGCAGSGKTQIMLHRLSYLLANHPKLSSANVRIISPSEMYNAFISLEKETLSIESINSVTLEEYYVYLLRKYDPNYTVTLTLYDEKNPFDNIFSVIYNSSNVFIESYNTYFADILRQLSIEKINRIIRKTAGKEIGVYGYTARTARIIIQTLYQTISTWDWKVRERNELFKKIQEAETALEIYQKNFENLKDRLKTATSQLKIWAHAERKTLQSNLTKHAQYQSVRKQSNDNESQISSMRQKIASINAISKELPSYITSFPKAIFQDYKTITKLSDPIARKIHTLLADLNRQINLLTEKYRINRSAQVQEQIEKLKAQYCNSFKQYVAKVYNKFMVSQEEKQHLIDRISQIEKQQAELQEQTRSLLSNAGKSKTEKKWRLYNRYSKPLILQELSRCPIKIFPKTIRSNSKITLVCVTISTKTCRH